MKPDTMSGVEDGDIDKAVYQMYKKQKIKELKHELGVVVDPLPNRRQDSCSFSGLSHYLAEVVTILSSEQREVILNSGLGSLLSYEKCHILHNFAKWVFEHVDTSLSALVLRDRQIPFSKVSVHKILGLPIGGEEVPCDSDMGLSALLSKFGLRELPDVTFFVDKLKGKEALSDELLVPCFLVVAMSCFLCPNSNGKVCCAYMSVFESGKLLKEFDWSCFVYRWLIDAVSSLKSRLFEPINPLPTTPMYLFGGCCYFICILYLDCLNFGHFGVSVLLPRITVWGGKMFNFYSDLDFCGANQYGKRSLKDVTDSQYTQLGPDVLDVCQKHDSLYQPSTIFRDWVDRSTGSDIPVNVKRLLCDIFYAHCSGIPMKYQKHCVRLAVSIARAVMKSKISCNGPTTRHDPHVVPCPNEVVARNLPAATAPAPCMVDLCNDHHHQLNTPEVSLKRVEDLNTIIPDVAKFKNPKKRSVCTPIPFDLNGDVCKHGALRGDSVAPAAIHRIGSGIHLMINLDDSEDDDVSIISPPINKFVRMQGKRGARDIGVTTVREPLIHNVVGTSPVGPSNPRHGATRSNGAVCGDMSFVNEPIAGLAGRAACNSGAGQRNFPITPKESSLYAAVCNFASHPLYSQ